MRDISAAFLLTCLSLRSVVAADVEAIAQRILDSRMATAEREALVQSNLADGVALLKAMTVDVPTDGPEEYRRIPWIWRVAIALAKRNDADQIRGMLDVSLPREGEPLRHWQAVVIGGGIINGLGLEGAWPKDRIVVILQGDGKLVARWNRSLELATTMADDEKVPTGTRYDALRMIAMLPWERTGEQLIRYLGRGVHDELQQGAISGVSDVKNAPVVDLFLPRTKHFSQPNRDFAVQALLRGEQRRAALKEALAAGNGKELPQEILALIRESK